MAKRYAFFMIFPAFVALATFASCAHPNDALPEMGTAGGRKLAFDVYKTAGAHWTYYYMLDNAGTFITNYQYCVSNYMEHGSNFSLITIATQVTEGMDPIPYLTTNTHYISDTEGLFTYEDLYNAFLRIAPAEALLPYIYAPAPLPVNATIRQKAYEVELLGTVYTTYIDIDALNTNASVSAFDVVYDNCILYSLTYVTEAAGIPSVSLPSYYWYKNGYGIVAYSTMQAGITNADGATNEGMFLINFTPQ